MGKRIVKNYPSPRLMETIGATNQSPQEAIGELVANCFDARYNDEKLDISIDLRDNRIIVVDNGKGMTSEVLEKAVCIAEDMSQHIERGEGAKGHFGMGFKTSCSTLGYFFEIYTRPVGKNVEYHTEFDIKDYSTRPSGSNAWDVIIEDGKPSASSPLKKAPHGTAFVISHLKIKDFPVSAVLEYIGNAFKGHIEQGDIITVIDENDNHQATPKKYSFLKGTKVKIDEKFGPKGKYHITGWVAIDSQTHNDGFYGFNIYRKGQLVLTHDKTWFRAHLMTSRIIGEVNMDFLDATFYKQGVQHSEDWEYVAIHMREFLKGVVAASYDLSRKGNINKPTERKAIISQLDKDYSIEKENTGASEAASENTPVEESKPTTSINNTVKSIVTEKSLLLEDGSEIQITFVEKEEDGHDVGPYDYIFDMMQEPQELQVLVYKNHPLWRKKIDGEVRRIIATSDAIYRTLVVELDVDSRKALTIRNEWVSQRTESM
jgi:hypothetical protein